MRPGTKCVDGLRYIFYEILKSCIWFEEFHAEHRSSTFETKKSSATY